MGYSRLVLKSNGLNGFDLSSWLQKSIRRWEIENALYYGNELIKTIWVKTYLMKKTLIYLVEDIGFANLDLAFKVEKLIKQKDISNTEVLKLIWLLASSNKSREIDNCICSYRNLQHNEDAEFFKEFDNELYFYNRVKFNESIGSNKELKDWILEGSNNNLFMNTEYTNAELYSKYKLKVIKNIGKYIEWMDYNIRNTYTNLMWYTLEHWKWDWILLYYTFFYLYSKFKPELEYEIDTNINFNLNKYSYETPREPADYIFDRHTDKGKKMGRWFKHFFMEWSKLLNDSSIFDNYYKNIIYSNLDKME